MFWLLIKESAKEEERGKMIINGATRICGLIGNPVEHTMSPLIHNTLAEKLGHNLAYLPFLVEKGSLREAIQGGFALNLLGMNVTVPYKSEVIAYLTEMDALAEKIGAVNTLVRTETGFKGYNTDMPGLYRGMCREGIELEKEDVVILGAGGAARAVAFLCAEKQAKSVFLLNRSQEKAKQVAAEVNARTGKELVIPMALADYRKLPNTKFLAIQGTSVGLYPDIEEAVIWDEEFYKKIHTGYDLIYKPAKTKFMQLVEKAGGSAYHGLTMLLYQGIIAYELWNHVQVSEESAGEVYQKLKEKMGIEE